MSMGQNGVLSRCFQYFLLCAFNAQRATLLAGIESAVHNLSFLFGHLSCPPHIKTVSDLHVCKRQVFEREADLLYRLRLGLFNSFSKCFTQLGFSGSLL